MPHPFEPVATCEITPETKMTCSPVFLLLLATILHLPTPSNAWSAIVMSDNIGGTQIYNPFIHPPAARPSWNIANNVDFHAALVYNAKIYQLGGIDYSHAPSTVVDQVKGRFITTTVPRILQYSTLSPT